MMNSIQVGLNYKGRANMVLFTYEQYANHQSYECLRYIGDWMVEHDVDFTVASFQVNQAVFEIPDPEIRTMLKLSFAPVDRQYVDDPPF